MKSAYDFLESFQLFFFRVGPRKNASPASYIGDHLLNRPAWPTLHVYVTTMFGGPQDIKGSGGWGLPSDMHVQF